MLVGIISRVVVVIEKGDFGRSSENVLESCVTRIGEPGPEAALIISPAEKRGMRARTKTEEGKREEHVGAGLLEVSPTELEC